MASSLVLKKLHSSNLLSNSLRASRQAAPASQSVSRLFNTNAIREFDNDDDRSLDADRRSNGSGFRPREFAPNPCSVVFNPFSSTRSLSQIPHMMDKFMDSHAGMEARFRRGWDAKETEDSLYLRMEMPVLGTEDVKVAVKRNTLIIKGESSGEESGDEDGGRKFSSRIDLLDKFYKTDQIMNIQPNIMNIFRPLSPHLPIYKPHLTSTFSISHRIAGRRFSSRIDLPDKPYKTDQIMNIQPNTIRPFSPHVPIYKRLPRISGAFLLSLIIIYKKVSSTFLLNLSVFWHINEGIEEIMADYVHQEMARNWILVSLRLFLIIAIKDVFLSLVFV